MANDKALRKHLLDLLTGGHAHVTFDQVVENFSVRHAGKRAEGIPHSAWELLEHMRIAQHDILHFSLSAEYVSPKWPEEYWPSSPQPEKESLWHDSVAAFRADLAHFRRLLEDPDQDLYRPFPWGQGQTLLREALLIADHNSYHLGQLVLVRKALGAWPS